MPPFLLRPTRQRLGTPETARGKCVHSVCTETAGQRQRLSDCANLFHPVHHLVLTVFPSGPRVTVSLYTSPPSLLTVLPYNRELKPVFRSLPVFVCLNHTRTLLPCGLVHLPPTHIHSKKPDTTSLV